MLEVVRFSKGFVVKDRVRKLHIHKFREAIEHKIQAAANSDNSEDKRSHKQRKRKDEHVQQNIRTSYKNQNPPNYKTRPCQFDLSVRHDDNFPHQSLLKPHSSGSSM